METEPHALRAIEGYTATVLESSPAFAAIVDKLVRQFPDAIAEGAVDIREEVIEAAKTKLRDKLAAIDTEKIVSAILANKKLRGKIMVDIEDLGMGFTERLMADIKAGMENETNLIRNLITARREQARARRTELQSQYDELKRRSDIARLQFALARMRFYKPTVAGPIFAVAFLAGAFAMANYFPAIACDKKVDVICSLRVRSGTYPPPQ